jgi:rhamnogalacturonyl hydrolase YesR
LRGAGSGRWGASRLCGSGVLGGVLNRDATKASYGQTQCRVTSPNPAVRRQSRAKSLFAGVLDHTCAKECSEVWGSTMYALPIRRAVNFRNLTQRQNV